ncbi:hypothetical protein GCM10011608_09680 [Micromonospora sonchi]|uniref:Uncharacterized protein n=1 Tax=Micromonospora sonchi TaxID=1763543 RepID=A0A917TKT4_9ACTN|nr:hypothetical protein [Micromonospora sonchi]GGM26942.1 hypothetical protein GCM10011608_09680 [Micromonospora sonchi]
MTGGPSLAEVVSAARVLLNALLYQPGQTSDVVEASEVLGKVVDRHDRSQPPVKDRP